MAEPAMPAVEILQISRRNGREGVSVQSSTWRAFSLVVAMTLGILSADRLRPEIFFAVAAGAVAVLFIASAWVVHRRNPDPQLFQPLPKLSTGAAALIVLGVFLAGFMSAGIRLDALRHGPLNSLGGRVLHIEGTAASDPERGNYGAIRLTVRISSADTVRTSQRVALTDRTGKLQNIRLGDAIVGDIKVDPLDQSDAYDRYLLRKSIAAKADLVHLEKITRTKNAFFVASNHIRARFAEATKVLPPADAGLLRGLLIGDRRGMNEELSNDFKGSGLYHLTAVSGANVALVLGAVMFALGGLRIGRRTRIVAGLIFLVFFAVLTRWEPSVLRASVMAGIALGAFFVGRRNLPLHAAAVAALLLLGADPLLAWSIGFQLSFAATLGILLLSPRIERALGFLPRWAATTIAATSGAQICVGPVLALHFGTISLAGLPANVLAVPLVPVSTILAFAAAVFSIVWLPAAEVFARLALPFTFVLRNVASKFASAPGSDVEIDGLALASAIAVAAVGFAASRRMSSLAKVSLVAALVVGFMLFRATAIPAAPSHGLRATFFDVGQGDSALIETKGGARILVDGGPDPHRIREILRRRNVDRLDLVVFSHAHEDHINGLFSVVREIESRLVLHPGVPDHRVNATRVPGLTPVADGSRMIIGDVEVQFVGPPAAEVSELSGDGGEDSEDSVLNDLSAVMRIGYAGACILLTGDVELEGQQRLVDRHRQTIACDVMKAPHHGSPRLLRSFVSSVDPEWVVVSVGRNDYGHPAPSALRTFESVGARVLRTDRLRDVVIDIGTDGRVRWAGP